jgi:hypothetical protein
VLLLLLLLLLWPCYACSPDGVWHGGHIMLLLLLLLLPTSLPR